MITAYAHSGNMHEAFNLFKQMIRKDIVKWNNMITGYDQVGEMEKAVKMFEEKGKKILVFFGILLFQVLPRMAYT